MFITLNRLFLHSFYLANVKSHIMVRNRQLSFFDQICQKSVFPVRKSTSGHYHPIQHILVSLDTKIHLNQIILHFWTKSAHKVYFWYKRENVNIIIKFSIFELVKVPNFFLDRQFYSFEPNFLKMSILVPVQKKWTSPSNSTC